MKCADTVVVEPEALSPIYTHDIHLRLAHLVFLALPQRSLPLCISSRDSKQELQLASMRTKIEQLNEIIALKGSLEENNPSSLDHQGTLINLRNYEVPFK